VPRNSEVIRQWTILREIERARGAGVTIDDLASLCAVTTRTIRRDLQALEESGFPLFDDKTHIEPGFYFTDFFRHLTPSLRLTQSF